MPSVSKVGDRVKSFPKFLIVLIAMGCFAISGRAQESQQSMTDAIAGYESAAHQSFRGLAADWSSHHVVYSKPQPGSDTEDKVQQNPRYWEQQIRRSLPESEDSFVSDVQIDDFTANKKKKVKDKKNKNKNKTTLTGLWEMNMDSAATSGSEMFPGTFTATTTPSCANATQPDFVVYNTNVAGGTPVAAKATNAGTFSNIGTPAGTVTITNPFTNPTASLVLTAAVNNTGNNFMVVANNGTTNAASLAARIAALGSTVGVTASSTGVNVTVTALNAGTDGNSITLAESLSTFTWGVATLSGGTNAATIMAFDNLYTTTCASFGTIPAAYWSYNTGGTEHTSPVVSQTGDEVAFVQSVGTTANLIVLKYAPGNAVPAPGACGHCTRNYVRINRVRRGSKVGARGESLA